MANSYFDILEETSHEDRVRRRSKKSSQLNINQDTFAYNNQLIDRFVESVNQMNRAVLVPNKLKDMELTQADIQNRLSSIPDGADLFNYYQMLNSVKSELFSNMIGLAAQATAIGIDDQNGSKSDRNNNINFARSPSTPTIITSGCERQTSDDSGMTSLNLLSSSFYSTGGFFSLQSDKSISGHSGRTHSTSGRSGTSRQTSRANSTNGFDTEDNESIDPELECDMTTDAASQMKYELIRHLHSLYSILRQFTRGAQFIAQRYQEEIEPKQQEPNGN